MKASKLTRRVFTKRLAAGLSALSITGMRYAEAAAAAPVTNPGKEWERFAKPEDGGFSSARLEAVERMLYPMPTTALLVVKSGKIVYKYGDISQVSYLASARKSVASMLYGKYVSNGTIDLERTIGELGIDESGGLLPIEKQATVRHLLMASSGVYYPAGSPGGNEITPPRGSRKPGTYFLYNNWDFNVVGAVFERMTGKTIFKALAEDLAGPLEFQDFDLSRQRMLGYDKPNQSRYKAYHMFLSGRDMARLGLVMVNGGRWNERQVIPAGWIAESTKRHVKASDVAGGGGLGYGYLWWLPSDTRTGAEWAGSYQANGNFGQHILGMPAIDTVIVHRRAVTDEFAIARNEGLTSASPAGGNADFLKVADAIVAARI
jgi:CubicO group peptidase (beta-lactamase class C family)